MSGLVGLERDASSVLAGISCGNSSSNRTAAGAGWAANATSSDASSSSCLVEGVRANGSATGAAEALLQQFLSSAQLLYTNLTAGSRSVITPVPNLQWGPAVTAAAGAANGTAGSSTMTSRQ